MTTSRRATAAIAAALLALSACESDGGSASGNDPGTKTGGDAAPITITIADSQPRSTPSNLPLDVFASEVTSISDGSMNVEIVYEVGDGADQAVIEGLRAGDFQMAVVPARAWSIAGVDSLLPLQAPFLVQSDAHTDAIVSDTAVVSSMFAGLDAVGVHGLTMFPESLRHLFSYTSPILTPDDVDGRHIRSTSSPDVAALISALGATAVDPPTDDEYHAAVDDGTITAFDSGFAIARGSNPRMATATGNLVLYSKMITLVANSGFHDGLSEQQRDTLTNAAQKTQDWAIANRVREDQAAQRYCAEGGTVVLTDSQSLADFRATVAPIYAELQQDVDVKRIIEAIDALAPSSPEASVDTCSPPATPVAWGDVMAKGGDLPNGVYRVEFTEEYLSAHRLTEADIDGNRGIWTFRLEDGSWSLDYAFENVNAHLASVYQVEGERVYWRWVNANEGVSQLVWSVDGDGALHFTEVHSGEVPDYTFDLPWQRIGDL